MVNTHKIAFLMVVHLSVTIGSLNWFDGDLHFECPARYQSITSINSDHSNHHEDRVFDMSCSDVAPNVAGLVTTCRWTDWVNGYDGLLAYTCDHNGYVNGMASHHDNGPEDRIWKIKCCEMHEIHLYDCLLTPWTNSWDSHQDFDAHPGYATKGVISIHDNHKEDRLYKYEICRVTKNEGGVLLGKRNPALALF